MKAEVYETFSAVEDKHWWFCARRRFIGCLTRVFVSFTQDDKICELGSGTGGNLEMLAGMAPVDAVEMDEYGRTCARGRAISGVSSVQPGSLPDDLPVTGPYKAVFSLDVIEHIEDDLAAVKAMASLLSDDGVLVLSVPAYQWMWSYHDEINHHHRRYNRQQLVQLVEKAGMEVIYASYFNTLLAPLAMLTRGLEKLLSGLWQPKKSTGLALPSAPVNRILESIFGLERFAAGRMVLPFGLSIALVARLKAVPTET